MCGTTNHEEPMNNDDVVALYRNAAERIEVEVRHDACEAFNPLTDKNWLRFLTLTNDKYRHGTEQLDRDHLDEELAEARGAGALVLPVFLMAHGTVAFSLGDFRDPWDSGQCGAIVVTDENLATAGLTREQATDEIEQLLTVYGYWCNGYGFRSRSYEIRKCDLGEVHRTETEAIGGFLGISHEETGLLEAAGVRDGDPPALGAGWEQVSRG